MKKYKWLNKDARDFLKRGYLQTGETAEKRGGDIAISAEKSLKSVKPLQSRRLSCHLKVAPSFDKPSIEVSISSL